MAQEKYTIKRKKGKHITLIERGSNENNNKLIRRYINKGIDIGTISEEEVKKIEEWMNSYLRKLFNGKSSLEYILKNIQNIFLNVTLTIAI